MDDLQRAQLKSKLESDREEILACLSSGAEAAKPVQLDQASVGRLSRMDAMQGQAMAVESQRRQQLQLRRIDVCLGRIDDQAFGFCADCDEPIDLRRLMLNPVLTRCIQCAQTAESSG